MLDKVNNFNRRGLLMVLVVLTFSVVSVASPPVYYSMVVNVDGHQVELVRQGNTYEYSCPGAALIFDGSEWLLLFGEREFAGAIDQVSGSGVFTETAGSGIATVGPCVRSWLYEASASGPMFLWGISTMLLVEFFAFLLRSLVAPIRALQKVLS